MIPLVSIIIVNYKVEEELIKCINSIYRSKFTVEFEILVVDNSDKDTVSKKLLRFFPEVTYIKSPKNIGYSKGNNLGAKYAKGEYLFFLNPDTKFENNIIDKLYQLIISNKKIGIVAPLLLDESKEEYQLQGTSELTPLKAILNLSFLSKIFNRDETKNKYYLHGWDRKGLREVDVCPGTAFMISKEIFDRVGGFDESFFLYFEEFDICKRVRELGFNIYIDSKAKLVHEWGISTVQFKDKEKVFRRSRFNYFKKHFGLLSAIITEFILRINKYWVFLTCLFILSFILRTYNLIHSMTFIGDQGWFYISARDMLLTGKIPLVGITSSHTWLHQGPLWTYILSVALFFTKFNPISGAYVTALFGTFSVVLIHKLGSEMFTKRIGIIAALLYAVSPLVVTFERMPYHTSPVAFFTIIYFFALYKWLNGSAKYFSVALFLLSILYSFELATFTLVYAFVALFAFGLIKNKQWLRNVLNKKIIVMSILAMLIPILPIIIYDFSNGFKQTVVFTGWTVYKPFSILFNHSSGNLFLNFRAVLNYLMVNLQKIIFKLNFWAAVLIFIAGLISLIIKNIKSFKVESSYFILGLLLLVSIAGILINQTPSDAYLPIVIPFVIFTAAILFDYLMSIKIIKYLSMMILVFMVLANSFAVVSADNGNLFTKRMEAVNKIIKLAGNKSYNLVGKGQNSQFISFTTNYEYLLWWKHHPLSKNPQKLKIVVKEMNGAISVYKK